MFPKKHRAFYNTILLLNEYQQAHPAEPLQYFIAKYDMTEVRRLLHELIEVALTTDNKAFNKPKARARAVRFAKDLEGVVEALHLLPGIGGEVPPVR